MAEPDVIAPESCILFATADWDDPYWTNKQHSAKSLAELGTKVLYVESAGLRKPKAGSAKDWRRLWKRLHKGLLSLFFGATERAEGVFVLSPLLIPAAYGHPLTRTLNRWMLRVEMARSMKKQYFHKPLIWTYHPFMLDVIKGIDRGPLLYHCVDNLAAVPGVDADVFRAAEKKLLQQADVVFATAPSLAEHCRQYNPNTHFLANVVDAEHFGRALEPGPIPDDLACIPEPRLCYHGLLSDYKIDFQLLLDCAILKPEWSWVLIGEEREGQRSPLVAELKTLPNVHFLGYKSYTDLPDYLRGMQIGLLPSLINDYTCGMFPMKYYEYIAAGLPVVSTSLDFLRSNTEGCTVQQSMSEFIIAIERYLSSGKFSKEDSYKIIRNNTWAKRCERMLSETTKLQKK